MKYMRILMLACTGYTGAGACLAQTFHYQTSQDVVGNIAVHTLEESDNFLRLAQTFRVGFDELMDANPDVDPWIPEHGAQIIIPTRYVLPDVERVGVVINLAELRIYHFHETQDALKRVSTYPISIGKGGQWETPLTYTHITAKAKKPSWYPPASIRKEHAENNDPLPRVVPPGPDNPLGDYALRLSLPGYLIHGTNVPEGIGMRVTHGCIRMHPVGIEKLFAGVKVKTPVTIINQPYKIGWLGDKLYAETHSDIEEQEQATSRNLTSFVKLVIKQIEKRRASHQQVRWERGYQEAREKSGVPFVILEQAKL